MLFRMEGLVLRGGVYTYRRMVPRRLRGVLGCREVKRTLGTGDLNAAQRRWKAVNAEVEQMFAEAEKAVSNPSVAGRRASAVRPTRSTPDTSSRRCLPKSTHHRVDQAPPQAR
jgi:hypothetical protein